VYGRQLSEDDKMRLNNEVKILKSLNNPHIIKCYGAWKDKEDEMNFVTELFTRCVDTCIPPRRVDRGRALRLTATSNHS